MKFSFQENIIITGITGPEAFLNGRQGSIVGYDGGDPFFYIVYLRWEIDPDDLREMGVKDWETRYPEKFTCVSVQEEHLRLELPRKKVIEYTEKGLKKVTDFLRENTTIVEKSGEGWEDSTLTFWIHDIIVDIHWHHSFCWEQNSFCYNIRDHYRKEGKATGILLERDDFIWSHGEEDVAEKEQKERREAALAELAAQAQQLNMGY